MARKPRLESESSIYHVMVRGVGQQIIFESDADRLKYLSLLGDKLPEENVELLAWCLMDNHVHLLVLSSASSLSKAMQIVDSTYASYFNLVHERAGHLFQGRFRSEPVETDEYLKTVVRYLHQNPVKAGMSKGCEYRWSSYEAFLNGELPSQSIDILGIFGGVEQFVEFHQDLDESAGPVEISEFEKRLDDRAALTAAKELLGSGLENTKGMPRRERDAALVSLKGAGLSVRQIQRLTGIPLGTIARAK